MNNVGLKIFHSLKKETYYFQEYLQCHGPVHTCFDGNNISSTLHVRVPTDMVDTIKRIPIGNITKPKCSLGYSQTIQTLLLVIDSDVFQW
jgi:hypothetical protein